MKTRIIVEVVIREDFEKNFMDSWIFCIEWRVALERGTIISIHFQAPVLFVSFDTREDVYKNKVIIPEENVRIRM